MNQYYYIIFPIELISFIGMAVGLMALKSKFPNIFFPPKDVVVYLPPTEDDLKK